MSKRKQGRKYNIAKAYSNSKKSNNMNHSKQLDQFKNINIIEPPYDPLELIDIVQNSDSLKQNLNAYATNICGLGFGIRYKEDFDYNSVDEQTQKIANDEWKRLENLYKNINPLYSFCEVMEQVMYDRELLGYGFAEVIRNTKGEVVGIEYCRASNIRICNSQLKYVEVQQWQNDYNNNHIQVPVYIKFKKFIQSYNGEQVYFKEFGDPRRMSAKTGKYEDDNNDDENKKINNDDLANELIMFSIHDGYSSYGSPRYSGVMVNACGSIQSEVLNYNYFKDGRINPSAILVSGGQLTSASIEALKDSKGLENAYKAIVIEADVPELPEAEKLVAQGTQRVNVDIKPLTDTMNGDALFQNYQKQNKDKVRDAFRLPPIYTGSSTDYNRATAQTARVVTEEQIFQPERKKIAGKFNNIINNELNIRYVEMYFKDPEMSSATELSEILPAFIQAGAVTPNMLIDILGEYLNKTFETLPDEIGNIPFDLVKINYQKNTSNTSEQIEKSNNEVEFINNLIDIINNNIKEGDIFG